ncbi:MAG: transglycosylase SLT domain-containing protein [Deltaproteobacteria bacterium]|nr:transglycosylase SLT domain-containing protein [Deltaproteobacteria bacterium]
MKKRCFVHWFLCSTFFFLGPNFQVFSSTNQLSSIRQRIIKNDYYEIFEILDSLKKDLKEEEKIFLEGFSFFKLHKWNQSISRLLLLKDKKEFLLRDYVLYLLGQNYFQKDVLKLSIFYFEKLFKEYPTFLLKKETQEYLAEAYFLSFKYEKSAPLYYKIYETKKNFQDRVLALFYSAYSYEKLGRTKIASSLYKQFWIKTPGRRLNSFAKDHILSLGGRLNIEDWYQYYIHIGDISKRLEKLLLLLEKTSLKGFQKIKPKILFQIAQCHQALGEYEKSKELFSSYYKEYGSPLALYRLARIHSKLEEKEEATRYYWLLATKFKKSSLAAKALYLAAFLQFEEKNFEKSRYYLGLQLKWFPYSSFKESTAWYIGWSYYLEKDFEKSAHVFESFLKQYRKSELKEQVTYWLAQSYFKNGKNEKAHGLLNDIFESNPHGYYGFLSEEIFGNPQLGSRGSETDKEIMSDLNIQSFENYQKAQVFKKCGLSEWASLELEKVKSKNLKNKKVLLYLAQEFLETEDYYNAHALVEIYLPHVFGNKITKENSKIWEIGFPLAYKEDVFKAAKEFNVDPFLILALMKAESNFRPRVVSHAAAYGLMQIIPETAREIASGLHQKYELEKLYEPKINIRYGAWYIHHLLNKFNNNKYLAIPSYNAGPHRVENWKEIFDTREIDQFVEQIPFKETRHYVKKVLRNYFIYKKLYGEEFPSTS